MTRVDYGDAMVCTDCYFAHHYGATKIEREATESEAVRYFHGYADRAYERELMGLEFEETPEGLQVTEWFAGESDQRCEGGEPLSKLGGFEIWDSTDSETGEGIEEFTWRSCQGCGSHLGGTRYRLHLTKEE